MKVDYHFHPNLLAKNPTKRFCSLWRAMERERLDVLVCTEHVYKNAPEAYRRLVDAKPAHLRTHIFPGAELLTSEGIDIIAFAEDDWYDGHQDLLVPYGMSLMDMLSELERRELHFFVPHPYLVNNKLRKLYPSIDAMRAFLQTVPAFEARNACYLDLMSLLSALPFKRLVRNMSLRFAESAEPPPNCLPEGSVFVAIGSDAHHPDELGPSVHIACDDPADRSTAFRAIVSNTDVSRAIFPVMRRPLRRVLRSGWTTMTEAWIKYEHRRQRRRYALRLERDVIVNASVSDQLLPAPASSRIRSHRKIRM